MSIRLTWLPNTEPDIAAYDWQRAPDVSGAPGTFVDLVTVLHDLLGPNYDPISQRFFYEDTTGSLTDWYRIRAKDSNDNSSGWSNYFRPSESTTPPPFPNTVYLNEVYEYPPGIDQRYVDLDSVPVANAQVRVYKKVDYDLGNFDAAIGTTTTNEDGDWQNPIVVEAGFTYVIHYFKPGVMGPDTKEIVVP